MILVSLETRLVSRETRGGKLRVSGTVPSALVSLHVSIIEVTSDVTSILPVFHKRIQVNFEGESSSLSEVM